MKKGAAILILIFYMLSTLGMSGTQHLCKGQLEAVYFLVDSGHDCCGQSCTSMTGHNSPPEQDNCNKSMDCCEEEAFYFQFDENYSLKTLEESQEKNIEAPRLSTFNNLTAQSGQFFKQIIPLGTSPPSPLPIYLKNCSLIFYA